LAAQHADGVDLTIGADPARISWALDVARAAAGARWSELSVGAFINVAVAPNAAVARDLIRGSAAIFAHLVSEGPPDVLPAADRTVIERLGVGYAESAHGLTAADHAQLLPDDFLDRFAVVGPPDVCVQRLRDLAALGLDRIIVVPGSRDADPALLAESNELFAREVLPAVRA
jgi:5,10-methylenetetrahydromethanopterin reductase